MEVVQSLKEAIDLKDLAKVYQLFEQYYESITVATPLDEIEELLAYLLQIGFFEQAKMLAYLLTERQPNVARWTILLADIYYQEGDFDQALSLLYDVPEDDSEYVTVLLIQAAIYRAQNASDIAELKIRKAKQLAPNERTIDFYLADILVLNQKYSQAILLLEQFPKDELNEHDQTIVDELLIEAYNGSGQYEEAKRLFQSLDQMKLSPNTIHLMAHQPVHQGEAVKLDEQVKELVTQSDTIEGTYLLAQDAYRQRKYLEALELVSIMLDHDPYFERAYELKYSILIAMRQIEAAIQTLEQWSEKNNENEQVILQLATLLIENQEYERAILVIKQAQEQQLFDPQFHWLLARAYNELEQFDDAKNEFQEAFIYLKETIDFLVDFVRFSREEGDFNLAARLIEQGLLLDPLNEELVALKLELHDYE